MPQNLNYLKNMDTCVIDNGQWTKQLALQNTNFLLLQTLSKLKFIQHVL
jgi:hypothetical protein